ncbi:MAG TPA: ABC transporter ATP-binding protein [Polyangiaceae bacterium]|nr:ABC transporter ATP-binding protein [Polyangiaceae bacterium]
MIEVEKLTKDYGTVVAVDDVSFSVGRGEIVGFLGPNGAGKSTTMRILAGFLGATSGRVEIAGHNVVEAPLQARGSLGYMPEAAPLYPEMRVREYLTFRARLKRMPRAERAKAVERAMKLASVTEMRDTLIAHLSKGYRQRVALSDALVSSPPLLILDEPTAGLDPNQIREVRSVIKGLTESHTILLSTHILSEVESTCDRALVIDRGKLIAEGSIDELRSRRRATSVTLLLRDAAGGAKKLLAGVRGVKKAKSKRLDGDLRRATLLLADNVDPQDVIEAAIAVLAKTDIGVREATPVRATLEEVFAQLTHADMGEGSDEADP